MPGKGGSLGPGSHGAEGAFLHAFLLLVSVLSWWEVKRRSVWIPGQSFLGPWDSEEKLAGVELSAHLGFGLQFERVSRKKNIFAIFLQSPSVAQASLKL